MKQRGTFLNCLAAAMVLAAALSGCKPAANTNEIVVGEYASLTGKEAAFGNSSHNGTLLAIDEINSKGGLLGKKLRLVTEDTQSKPGESATVVQKLLSRDGVVAVLGEVASGRSLEAARICQNAQVPMISPSSTNPEVTKKGDYVFRVCFIDPFQGTVMAKFARDTLKITKVAVLSDASAAYSVGLADFFKQGFVAAGGEVVAEPKYTSGDKDFKAQLTAIKAANPQGIFVPGYYTEAGLIVSQARQLGIDVPLFGGDGWEAPQLLEIGGKAMEGCYFSTHFSPEVGDPLAVKFVADYEKRFGAKPDAMAALGYDSALILAEAIAKAGSTEGPKLRDALAATKDFKAVTGMITIDADRNASKSAVILAVKDGQFKYLQSVSP